MKKMILLLALVLLFAALISGCAERDSLKKINSAITVIEMSGDAACEGTEEEPCMAVVKFAVNSTIVINPMQLLEVDTPVRQVKGYSKQATFEPGHTYTLKYEVLKNNPDDTIKWSFAGRE